jgi:hypothetical protein
LNSPGKKKKVKFRTQGEKNDCNNSSDCHTKKKKKEELPDFYNR